LDGTGHRGAPLPVDASPDSAVGDDEDVSRLGEFGRAVQQALVDEFARSDEEVG